MSAEKANIEKRAMERRVLLMQAGKRPVDVARRLRVHRSLITHVLDGSKRSARVENCIAGIVKLSRASLWP